MITKATIMKHKQSFQPDVYISIRAPGNLEYPSFHNFFFPSSFIHQKKFLYETH
jgi:hypothetical protein